MLLSSCALSCSLIALPLFFFFSPDCVHACLSLSPLSLTPTLIVITPRRPRCGSLGPNTNFLTRLVKSTDRTNQRRVRDQSRGAAAALAAVDLEASQRKALEAKYKRGMQLLNHVAKRYDLKVKVFPLQAYSGAPSFVVLLAGFHGVLTALLLRMRRW